MTQKLDKSQFLFKIQNGTLNSFSSLHTALGYSLTEWRCEENLKTAFKEVILEYNTKALGSIRIKTKDPVAQSAEIQLYAFPDADPVLFEQKLKQLLEQLVEYENTTRFYCFVFYFEKMLIKILTALDFKQEAVFEQHIYSRGKYWDLLLFGSQRLNFTCD